MIHKKSINRILKFLEAMTVGRSDQVVLDPASVSDYIRKIICSSDRVHVV